MKSYPFICFLFVLYALINSCSSSALNSNTFNYDFNESSFDVVEKKISFSNDLPSGFIDPLNYWFNNRIRLTGYEGIMLISIKNYTENVINIADGKKVEILMNFEVSIKQSNNKTKNIAGEVKSYSEISGVFSLNELDNLIEKTRYNLVVQFSNKLSK